MGNMIGILSTVILVSTLATLIFAVTTYVIARKRRAVAGPAAPEAETREVEEEHGPRGLAPRVDAVAAASAAAPKPPRAAAEGGEASGASEPGPSPTKADAKPHALFRRLTPTGERPAGVGHEGDKPEWQWE